MWLFFANGWIYMTKRAVGIFACTFLMLLIDLTVYLASSNLNN